MGDFTLNNLRPNELFYFDESMRDLVELLKNDRNRELIFLPFNGEIVDLPVVEEDVGDEHVGDHVLANELEGKVIVLHFIELVLRKYCESTSSLVDIYKEFNPQGCFEVVLIAVTSNQELNCFPDIFYSMPWPAIPLSDLESRKNLEAIFIRPNRGRFPSSYVIDPTGVVLNCHADVAFHIFGAHGYPFSYEQINLLWSEDAAAIKNPNITALLTSPQRDYVISMKRGKVAASDLEDKTVALYFFDECTNDVDLTYQLEEAYEMLANNDNFEVVLIYVSDTPDTYQHTSQKSFQRRFNTMPWLALPFGDPTCKKLERIFRYPVEDNAPDSTLVIIGPHGRFIEQLGKAVLLRFGIKAYPFTREAAAKLEAKKARKLNLEMLCQNPYMFFKQKDGTKVRFSQLVGKRTILVLGSELLKFYKDFFKKLKARYLRMKGTSTKFEVIHLTFVEKGREYYKCYTEQGSPFDKCVAHTLWPVAHFPTDSKEEKLISLHTGILGFDSDGRLVMRTVAPSRDWVVDMDFPFHARSLEEDALIVFTDGTRLGRTSTQKTAQKMNNSSTVVVIMETAIYFCPVYIVISEQCG